MCSIRWNRFRFLCFFYFLTFPFCRHSCLHFGCCCVCVSRYFISLVRCVATSICVRHTYIFFYILISFQFNSCMRYWEMMQHRHNSNATRRPFRFPASIDEIIYLKYFDALNMFLIFHFLKSSRSHSLLSVFFVIINFQLERTQHSRWRSKQHTRISVHQAQSASQPTGRETRKNSERRAERNQFLRKGKNKDYALAHTACEQKKWLCLVRARVQNLRFSKTTTCSGVKTKTNIKQRERKRAEKKNKYKINKRTSKWMKICFWNSSET